MHPDLIEFVGGYYPRIARNVGGYVLKKNSRDHLVWLHQSAPRVHCIQFLEDDSWGAFCTGEVLIDDVSFEDALETAYEEMTELSADALSSY
jgi:hypothetical protein